ncbi:E3 ubiquitin/ISG15 ligase TRIM25-like [Denticeps clupeoides]|uniref:E3 ubiquitin/ISG15 ligase TRIM25-like n=1 Tax=Denticeps clupeoides TaxID=299321 RepID=UPI0010A3F08D|nr:E3 ubiquitin/ISG15 ligase TRIM25-like [Denticeps clupeoides]
MSRDNWTEDMIKCPLCLRYLFDPTTLPCGHNICMTCISDFWDTEADSGIYSCPQCQRSLTRRPSLCKNTMLAGMVKKFTDARINDSVNSERLRIKLAIEERKLSLENRIKDREDDLEKLRAVKQTVEESAKAMVEESEKVFTELITTIETKKEVVKVEITEREKNLLTQAVSEQRRISEEVSTLRERCAELDTLATEQNMALLLQRWQRISSQPEQGPLLAISDNHSFESMRTDMTDLKNLIVDICDNYLECIQKKVKYVQLLQSPVVKPRRKAVPRPQSFAVTCMTRGGFLQHACPLTLDPSTAHHNLHISKDNKKATYVPQRQRRKATPKTFDCWEQVICQEGLAACQSYWEVEWTGKNVSVGVTLESIGRKGRGLECGLGRSNASWNLRYSEGCYTTWHDNIPTYIDIDALSPRLGVFLNQTLGTLTFYSVTETLIPLHTYNSHKFRDILYPAFGVEKQSSIKIYSLAMK